MEIIKLSEYAKRHGVTYRTAWEWFRRGKIPGAFKDEHNRVLVQIERESPYDSHKAAIYARVSSSENRNDLESQAERLKQYAIAKGYQVVEVVKEVGSGVNDNRRKLLGLLQRESWGILIVEHKDRLTRFGFNYLEVLLDAQGRRIEVVNLAEEETSDLMQDLIAIISSFSARIYGIRRSKRKTEKIIEVLQADAD
ncbi:transposase, IS607 family [Methylomarinovum caldicuralii]|uniref:Transposase, IS607 family n=1 Tax=Methylomarinovum caldicuralii TaxID=438856 RepID=A0AAU9CS42_9GAMM|nr:IS607 family transposase [Methylomarinovum caldicuralii]BCX82793.1 transposase, IS607 family [Methylomarinovum caldicuralii]